MRFLLIVGVSTALLMGVVGIFAPVLSPYDPLASGLGARMIAPGGASPEGRVHVLGTDQLGGDVLSRIVWSFRTNLYIGLVGTFVGVLAAWLLILARSRRNPTQAPDTLGPLFGVSLGSLAIIVYLLGLLPAMMVFAVMGYSFLLVTTMAGLLSAVLPMALVYESARNGASALSPVRSALMLGGANSPVAFSLALLMGLLIESSLSFLGIGVPPTHPSLGGMISSGRTNLVSAPWISGFPALVLLAGAVALAAIAIPVGRQHRIPQPAASPAGQAKTLSYAGFWIRVGAFLVDSALVSLAIIPLVVILSIGAFAGQIGIFIAMVVGYLAYIAFCVWVCVHSPGKRALGLRILRTDGSTAGPARRLFRFLVNWCLGPSSVISIIMVACRKDRRGLHDLLLDTVVVRSNVSAKLPPTTTAEPEPPFEITDFRQADCGGEGRRRDAR